MSKHLKFLPALALAVALVPYAANARSGRTNVQDSAPQQFLVGEFGNGSAPGFALGRAVASNPAGNQLIVISAEQYAAAASAVPEEN